MDDLRQTVTLLLARVSDGQSDAVDELLPLVYEELRRLAGAYLAAERPDHTLQATALVHEAFLRLVGSDNARWESRAHFYRVAAMAMRRVLVNHARDRARLKRGGGGRRVALDESLDADPQMPPEDLLALDEALDRLATVDERKVQVAQPPHFGGSTGAQPAQALARALIHL